MDEVSSSGRKAQLDKEEREHLEDVVTEMRERIEANVRYKLESLDLEERPDEDVSLSEEKENLVEAIDLESVDGNDWEDGYEEYKNLAEEIGEDCEDMTKAIPSDWSDRALSEITTAGYEPNHKHGVAINITPLAEAEVVPEIVEDKVV